MDDRRPTRAPSSGRGGRQHAGNDAHGATGSYDWNDQPAADYGFVLSGNLDAELFGRAVQGALARWLASPDGLIPVRSELAAHPGGGLVWLVGLPLGDAAGPDIGELCCEVAAAYREPALSQGSQPTPEETLAGVPETHEPAELARFWHQVLAGAPAVLDLPADRLRPAAGTFRARSLNLGLPAAAADADQGADAFDRLLATMAVLLYRMTGEDDIVLGARPLAPLAVPRPVPVRLRVRGGQPFGELLSQVSAARAAAVAHRAGWIGRITAATGATAHAGYHPVFQVLVEDRQAIAGALRLPGVEVAVLPPATAGWSPYDLRLSADMTGPGQAALTYSADLFDEAAAGHLAAALRSILAAAVTGPDTAADDLPLLGEHRRAAVIALNRTAAIQHGPVRLARPASAAGPAVIDAETGRQVSYADLHAWADWLAGQLQAVGVGAGSTVGLFLPRSVETIAAMFAVLRLGAAYLPIDVDYPADRIALVISQARAHAVVTSGVVAGRLPPSAGIPLIRADSDVGTTPGGKTWPQHPDAASAAPPPADSAAYVMYTSGSTGRPRAVQVLHRGLAAYVRAATERYQLGPADRVLQFSSLGFDVSAEEIFPCLSVGATLVLRSQAMIATPEQFLAELDEHGVTVAHLPASYFHELAAHLTGSALRRPPSLRLVVTGGEPVAAAHARAWLDWTGTGTRLVNVYGITETTIVTTMTDLTSAGLPDGSTSAAGRVPIGRPIPGSDVYVLDDRLRPVPPGFPGEICIAGAGLARGYLGQPGATARRFVAHPFAAGQRLYRSGDIGRVRADGTLECLGRADRQVKLHGYRIELGEVEAALCRIPEVDEAAVSVRQDRLGRDSLIGHVTIVGGAWALPDQLRAEVAAILPHYLVPSVIVLLDEMPHSDHDKIDYRALPGPGTSAGQSQPPAGPAELAVADAWRQVLDLDMIGSQDNFFELGGHSLAAMQVTTKLRETFGPGLAVTVLFEHPTLADFAAAAASGQT